MAGMYTDQSSVSTRAPMKLLTGPNNSHCIVSVCGSHLQRGHETSMLGPDRNISPYIIATQACQLSLSDTGTECEFLHCYNIDLIAIYLFLYLFSFFLSFFLYYSVIQSIQCYWSSSQVIFGATVFCWINTLGAEAENQSSSLSDFDERYCVISYKT